MKKMVFVVVTTAILLVLFMLAYANHIAAC